VTGVTAAVRPKMLKRCRNPGLRASRPLSSALMTSIRSRCCELVDCRAAGGGRQGKCWVKRVARPTGLRPPRASRCSWFNQICSPPLAIGGAHRQKRRPISSPLPLPEGSSCPDETCQSLLRPLAAQWRPPWNAKKRVFLVGAASNVGSRPLTRSGPVIAGFSSAS